MISSGVTTTRLLVCYGAKDDETVKQDLREWYDLDAARKEAECFQQRQIGQIVEAASRGHDNPESSDRASWFEGEDANVPSVLDAS
eukprot:2649403-Rhodomonas_salina.1